MYEVISPDQEFRFDGKRESVYLPGTKQYQFPEPWPAAQAPFSVGINSFFEGPPTYQASDEKSVQLDGKSVTAVSLNEPGLAKPITLYVNPQTLLPIGYDEPMEGGIFQVRYRELKLDEPMQATSFAWSPPKDAKAMETTDYQSKLIKPESPAPGTPSSPTYDFAGGGLGGGRGFAETPEGPVFDLGVPVLGICYGQQAMARALGGRVEPTGLREYGRTTLAVSAKPVSRAEVEAAKMTP